jgi:type VI secretion system protein ImpA
LLNVFLRDFWESVHPQLDPDDDNDPTLRLNTLQMLNEYSLIALALDRVKLVELQGLGSFGVREVALAEGRELPDEDEQVPDLNIIRQAFASTDQGELAALRQALDESINLLTTIDSTWLEKSGDAEGLGFDVARKSLLKVAGVLARFTVDSLADQELEMTDSEALTSGVSAAASSTVNTRSDVIRMLDRVCEYYSVHEPSSPVPLLLRRAQRLVEKSFMEILEDMVPDGVSQAKIVSGSVDEE